ncbi:MAG: hypothetical protein AAGI53_11365 [Planctomycetota bacterium]
MTINRLTKTATLVLLAGTAFASGPLDLEHVTLYRSGVGSFERRGVIEGNEDISIRFDRDRINDILKSMVLLDVGGGRIEAVGYDSKEPIDKRLAGFAIDVRMASSLFGLLRELQGTPVELKLNDSSVRGTVVGLEQRSESINDLKAITVGYVTLLTDGQVRAIDLRRVINLEILDERLASELKEALAVLAEARGDNDASVDLRFRGDGVRPVIVGYVHEAPVWKTSYRLVLPEPVSGAEATLQGWAIVENTTDEDWDDVSLTLVSGRPVGFTMDLYQPLFLKRPEVPVPVETVAKPKTYESNTGDNNDALMQNITARTEPSLSLRLSAMSNAEAFADYAPPAQATASSRGELFVYDLDQPVTIERRRSAMIPILSSAISARRVSIYNSADLAAHPMRGVEITNDSGLKLMPGPITVFDDGAFAGDAQIGTTSTDETRLLAHAVDLDVSVDVERTNERRLRTASIRGAALRRTYTNSSADTYAFTNRDSIDRIVLIEVPKRPAWTLASPTTYDTTDTLYRVELSVPAGKTVTQTVRFERVISDSIVLTDYPIETLIQQQSSRELPDKIVAAIERAAGLKRAVIDATNRLNEIEAERQSIGTEQDRLRKNMQTLERSSELYRRYVRKLTDQEDRISELLQEHEAAINLKKQAERALRAYLDTIDID